MVSRFLGQSLSRLTEMHFAKDYKLGNVSEKVTEIYFSPVCGELRKLLWLVKMEAYGHVNPFTVALKKKEDIQNVNPKATRIGFSPHDSIIFILSRAAYLRSNVLATRVKDGKPYIPFLNLRPLPSSEWRTKFPLSCYVKTLNTCEWQPTVRCMWHIRTYIYLVHEWSRQILYGMLEGAKKNAHCPLLLLPPDEVEDLSHRPPPITQDLHLRLSKVQRVLYYWYKFYKPSVPMSTQTPEEIRYKLKVCTHPLLVLRGRHSGSLWRVLSEAMGGSSDVIKDLHELHHSPKLLALKVLLEEAGIGLDTSLTEHLVGVGHHRVLIVARNKASVETIESVLFQTHMKRVRYLRLDVSFEQEQRFGMVATFNSDTTIDVLLLTSHDASLALNMTTADTVIFVELLHEDQMIRNLVMNAVHRLAEQKVVHVYRLIMEGTVEHDILNEDFLIDFLMQEHLVRPRRPSA